MLIHLALDEERALLGVEPRGQQQRGGLAGEPPHPRRVVFDRERVQIDDAEQRVGTVLVLLTHRRTAPSQLPRVRCPLGLIPLKIRRRAVFVSVISLPSPAVSGPPTRPAGLRGEEIRERPPERRPWLRMC
ncbi:hypothetical protein SANTM175S_06425 [Streptomyces antimycoticus]